ncbi:Na+/H+ antiporter NhaA [Streptomyces macrosporus]|uniref:Na(+)/H(+) antiporter NhaA n=1 Tax=Streptomyces macrosporus TaxID=44032 RepID=A0ABP5X608_9ACTN
MNVPAGERGPSGQTVRGGETASALRDFLRTETGSAVVLVVSVLAALGWANLGPASYEEFWRIHLSVRAGPYGVSLELREWVNSGLMTLFFFVVGLETRREFDVGELRERRRLTLPLLAGVCGMVVPVAVYLAVNAGHGTAYGWGAAMSTDTAFALGLLSLFGRRMPAGLRIFVLTVSVVDDFAALGVIALAYSGHVTVPALLAALGVFGAVLLVRSWGVRRGGVYVLLAVALWLALLESGVEPVVAGLAMGLLTYAYPAARGDLERASGLFRLFREQPTPELERSVRLGLASAISPNDRLQRMYHPWSSYVIVPLFALANAGITVSGERWAQALGSPVTLGVLLGYTLGKPLGILGASVLGARLSRGRLHPSVGMGSVAVGGTISGVGFTVSLLIAAIAFDGARLEEAKIGILGAVVCSSALTWLVVRGIGALPRRTRLRALHGRAEGIVDLAVPVDPERDHVRGPRRAPVTVVEYGDFECPYCGQAEPVVRELLANDGDVRYVWRHFPLDDVHVHARLAAAAAEAAAAQGRFWEMHNLLFAHQDALRPSDLRGYAEELGLDADRFHRDLGERAGAARLAADEESADLSGVSGTPTFFVNGRRYQGAFDIDGLTAAVRAARERAALAP